MRREFPGTLLVNCTGNTSLPCPDCYGYRPGLLLNSTDEKAVSSTRRQNRKQQNKKELIAFTVATHPNVKINQNRNTNRTNRSSAGFTLIESTVALTSG